MPVRHTSMFMHSQKTFSSKKGRPFSPRINSSMLTSAYTYTCIARSPYVLRTNSHFFPSPMSEFINQLISFKSKLRGKRRGGVRPDLAPLPKYNKLLTSARIWSLRPSSRAFLPLHVFLLPEIIVKQSQSLPGSRNNHSEVSFLSLRFRPERCRTGLPEKVAGEEHLFCSSMSGCQGKDTYLTKKRVA